MVGSAGVGEKGEIVIRMPEDGSHPLGLFRGYYRDEAMTQQVLHDGLYHTCDVGLSRRGWLLLVCGPHRRILSRVRATASDHLKWKVLL